MTRQETGIIMDILTAAYPRFYSGVGAAEMRNVVNLWAEMFAGDDVAMVAAAVKALISTDEKGFPPVVGQVRNMLTKLTAPPEMTEGEAWALVSKAVRNGAYGAQEEFDALPENVKRIVGSPNQLRDWSQMDSETVHSVVSSNFQRAFRTRAATEKQYRAMPQDIKALVAGVAEKLALTDGGGQ